MFFVSGVFWGSSMIRPLQTSAAVESSFFQLRQLDKLKPVLSTQRSDTVIRAFMTSRLDYFNVLYVRVSGSSVARPADGSTPPHVF